MDSKRRKLGDQFAAASTSIDGSRLFADVAVFVNGRTEPPADELRRIVMAHGGVYHAYSCAQTTHHVAQTLARGKLDKLKTTTKSPTVYVRPAWITDSLAAQRLLPVDDYLLVSKCSTTITQFLAGATSTTDSSNAMPTLVEEPQPSTSSHFLKTCHPDFIASYYARSRLHHISALAVRSRTLVEQLIASKRTLSVLPGVEQLIKAQGYGIRWCHIFFIAALPEHCPQPSPVAE